MQGTLYNEEIPILVFVTFVLVLILLHQERYVIITMSNS